MNAIVKSDLSPQAIGGLFLEAHDSAIQTNDLLLECGERLKAKRASLQHGEWLPWLEANSKILGFGERTAQLLIKAAISNTKLTSDLPPADPLKINRLIWGNASKAAPRISREPAAREDSRIVATVQASVPGASDPLKKAHEEIKRLAKNNAFQLGRVWDLESKVKRLEADNKALRERVSIMETST